jgi:hypothetical protein
MGMETLNSAARAAGFAMVVADETQSTVEAKPEAQRWRSGHPAVLVHHDSSGKMVAAPLWLKNLLNILHRRAPA